MTRPVTLIWLILVFLLSFTPTTWSAEEGQASGALVVGDKTFAFDGGECSRSAIPGVWDMIIIKGKTRTAEGVELDLLIRSVDRGGGSISHEISLSKAGEMTAESQLYDTHSTHDDSGWRNLRDEDTGPLIIIDGNNVSASGVFADRKNNGYAGQGTLTVTCTISLSD